MQNPFEGIRRSSMAPKNNVVGWFEIPVKQMERAIQFYETVFDLKLTRHQIGSLDMAWFGMG
jgi:predicted enzyme related to lactoylglutathione lyase